MNTPYLKQDGRGKIEKLMLNFFSTVREKTPKKIIIFVSLNSVSQSENDGRG